MVLILVEGSIAFEFIFHPIPATANIHSETITVDTQSYTARDFQPAQENAEFSLGVRILNGEGILIRIFDEENYNIFSSGSIIRDYTKLASNEINDQGLIQIILKSTGIFYVIFSNQGNEIVCTLKYNVLFNYQHPQNNISGFGIVIVLLVGALLLSGYLYKILKNQKILGTSNYVLS
ncbi:MAG: hypothetical protein ACFFCQ_16415, partial [Promethearchaeota archaeon]